MDLPLLSALFAAFALTLYVLLDGFDLGVGGLLLLERDERMRDHMIDAIVPTWDANETWLIMAGVVLLAAFPTAYGILLPAFYLPLIAMLLCLGLRGVTFEFRIKPRALRQRWDGVFAAGSIGAALAQGLVVGGLIQGVSVESDWFSGTPFDVFSPFTFLTAATLLVGYLLLGAGWLHFRGSSATREFARRQLTWITVAFSLSGGLTCAAAFHVQPGISAAWSRYAFVLVGLASLFFSAAVRIVVVARSAGCRWHLEPFGMALGMFACGILGLGLAIYPNVVPFRLAIWDTASGTASHMFLLIGVAFVTPVVLAYNAFAYWIFRGETPEEGWDA